MYISGNNETEQSTPCPKVDLEHTYYSDLYEAIDHLDLPAVIRRLETSPIDVIRRDDPKRGFGYTPLHHIIRFCTRSTYCNRHCDSDDPTQAEIARYSPDRFCALEILRRLLLSPYGKEALIIQSQDGLQTPLHICCHYFVLDDALIAVAQANPAAIAIRDEDGDTPLHAACRYGNSDLAIRVLVDLSYECVMSSDRRHLEIDYDDECLPFAMADYADGDLPLHVAISHEASVHTVRLLLDAYPLSISAYNGYYQTPLHVAAESGRFDIVEVILMSHAATDITVDLLKMRDAFGLSPMELLWKLYTDAVLLKRKHSVDYTEPFEFLECIANIVLIATFGYEYEKKVNTETFPEEDALHLLQAAVTLGENIIPVPFIKLLMHQHPKTLLQKDKDGRTLLHLAIMHYLPIDDSRSKLLIDVGFDLAHDENPIKSRGTGYTMDAAIRPKCVVDARFRTSSLEGNLDDLHNHDSFRLNNNSHLKNSESENDDPIQFESCYVLHKESIDRNAEMGTSFHSRNLVKVILDENPSAASISDGLGRLPLHYASVTNALSWEQGNVKDLLIAFPEALLTPDPCTGLHPFMLAASANNMDLTFNLLKNTPHLIGLANVTARSDSGNCCNDPTTALSIDSYDLSEKNEKKFASTSITVESVDPALMGFSLPNEPYSDLRNNCGGRNILLRKRKRSLSFQYVEA